MLVLTRNVNGHNTLIFQTSDGDIEISIRDVKGGKVQLGIEVPESVDVWRSEVFDKAEVAA
jgi:carbon storage regulator CsrA